MKTIGTTNYYNKQEIAAQTGCSLQTLNKRISAAKVHGFYFGHAKHYTEEQIRQIFEYGREPQQ